MKILKKFIIIISIFLLFCFIGVISYYNFGIYIDFNPKQKIQSFTKTDGKTIYLNKNQGFKPFEIKGVNLGLGIPGKFATEYVIDKKTYLRWFKQIKEMGANTIRVYTLMHSDFYEAVYEYNQNNPDPIYILHGVWVNDYTQYSHLDAFSDEFLGNLINDSKTLVDIIHGNKMILLDKEKGFCFYNKDISKWVLGYIVGVEWEDVTVAYTDNMKKNKNIYNGKYMFTKKGATPFEAMLAQAGDKLIEYESTRYKQQRLVAFSNWPTTDPIDYPEKIAEFFRKIAKVDVEKIGTSKEFIGGTFASYHIYPYYPDFLAKYDDLSKFVDSSGKVNTYYSYLKIINEHHKMPVVVSEFGIPTSRGMAQRDKNTGRSQGNMSEKQQGQALVNCYKDIKAAGCSGSIVFSWQDEWFKRTWNTMHLVDLKMTPFWSDYQTNEQNFGILAFDPGKEKSVCYVDGKINEWNDKDLVYSNNNYKLSKKYDERYMYFLVQKKNFNKEKDILYLPIDTTPKSGSNYSKNFDLKFSRNADFLIVLNGVNNSRILVQQRYDVQRAMNLQEITFEDPFENPPAKNSPLFVPIKLLLQNASRITSEKNKFYSEEYETGLLTYGNANPSSKDFNSLADFCISGDNIEIKIPWQLLNFSNPSKMMIHDDYYAKYGVENLSLEKMYVGVSEKLPKNSQIQMVGFGLKGWGKKVTFHERLKSSYYIMQKLWNNQK